MAGLLSNLQNVLGGAKSAVSSAVPSDADDFADFATAAAPAAPSHVADTVFSAASASSTSKPPFNLNAFNSPSMVGRPFTKWYRIWERVTIADFYQELFILPIILTLIIVNLLGTSANRRRAKEWAKAHYPLLDAEFAKVGFGGKKEAGEIPSDLWKEKSKNEFTTYASGRQNVAWVDLKITLYKRFNPFIWAGELALSFFMDSIPPPQERLEATAYVFDGREKQLVPAQAQGQSAGPVKDSTYDGFVWAVVHKDKMRELRSDRYDLSLTSTKDHPKLPAWITIMSESAEISEAILTPDLIKAITNAGDDLEALIISDQPIDAPQKLNELVPKKRVQLSTRLNTNAASVALFTSFLRLPDFLVNHGHFRPEALRKVRSTREEEVRKIKKIDDDEKAEERRLASDKLKKDERDRRLGNMSAEEQRKFLEKEKEKQQRKREKKQTTRA